MADETTRRAEIALKVYGEPVQISLDIPAGKTTPRRMLPVFRKVCHSIVDAAVAHAEKHGRKVSCSAGCGACCRQLVPVSPVEASVIKELVDSFPVVRKTKVLARFAEAKRILHESGLLASLESNEKPVGHAYKELGLAYFRLGIPCPFLENESCSIHSERPLVCREYLVVSPPENCSRKNGKSIEMLVVPGEPSKALAGLFESSQPCNWVPLTLALDGAGRICNDETPMPGEEIAKEFLRRMVNSGH